VPLEAQLFAASCVVIIRGVVAELQHCLGSR
jgi:hypothetical protein